jgi:hypothetical protein
LFATDLAYLQELYNRINTLDDRAGACPHCGKALGAAGVGSLPAGERMGEWSATPSIN